MFAVSPDCTNKALLDYLALEPVKSSKCALEKIVGKKRKKRMYTYTEEKGGVVERPKGLTKFLRKTFYKHYRRVAGRFRKHSVKLPSNKALGKRVDKEIFTKIAGKKPRGKLARRQLHPMTDAVFRYWTARGLTPVAAQVPVQLPELNVMTQADVIVEDRQGDLWMHEIKTGYCGMRGAQGTFTSPFEKYTCTKGNQWDMQRHFTEVKSKKLPHAPVAAERRLGRS
jgi:hypothetical protein